MSAPRGPRDDPADVADLLAAGRHAEAAAACRAAGRLARARELYERIWDFRSAAACALEAGDRVAALGCYLDARALDEAARLGAELAAGTEAERRGAAEVLEARRHHGEAATIREALGDLERAAGLYQKAGLLVEAGRALERLDRPAEALRLYERFLGGEPEEPAAAAAHLALGALLARLGRHEEATRHLQAAARTDATALAARRLLPRTLEALGLRDAAREAHARARELDPALPATLEEALAPAGDAAAAPREDGAPAPIAPARGGDAASPGPAAPLVGGRWRLLQALGAGGAGRVYRARDEVAGRDVAVKLYHGAQARGGAAYERFVREARICAALQHPNVVAILDFREDLGFTVMELMAGGTLRDRIRPWVEPPAVRRMALDVLAGLQAAHSLGVIHRDIKPANVFFDVRGTAKLGDFGVAHLLDLGQTQTGGLIGTLAYMPPEQITGAPLTGAADLYAFGVTIFEALTGRLPFLGPDFIAGHLGEPAPAPSRVRPALGRAWDPLLSQLLAKDPAARPAAIEEVTALLRGLEATPRPVVLALGRAPEAGAPTTRSSPGAIGGRDAPAEPAPGGAAPGGAERYRAETPLGATPISTLHRALDAALDRSVVLERFAEGQPDAPTEARLLRLAAHGGPFLQRVLAYARADRTFVYEAPVGEPLATRLAGAGLAPPEARRVLARLERGLEALHAAGFAHGAVAADRVVLDDTNMPTLLVAGLGPAPTDATPANDAAALRSILGSA